MKTILKYTFAAALLAFALNTNANTNTPPTISPLTEEAYIDDIPFSTQNIFDSLYDLSITDAYALSEEAYIQDIPFNTREVIESSTEANTCSFDLEEETYVDDIPFSTEAIIRS